MGIGHYPDSQRRRIGIFGGTFDPIHFGHISIAEFVVGSMGLDELLFVPAGSPRLRKKKPVATGMDRYEMIHLTIRDHPYFSVSSVDIDRPGTTYTFDTLNELRGDFDKKDYFFLIVGSDSARRMHEWGNIDEINEMCEILILGRPGYEWPGDLPDTHPAYKKKYLNGPMVDINATEIRRKIKIGEPVDSMVSRDVEKYIFIEKLYQ